MAVKTVGSLKRLWLGPILLHAVTVVHLFLYVLFSGDRGRSLSFRILALGLIALAAGVIGFTVWLNDSRLETIRRLARPLFWPVIAGSLAILMAYGALIRPEWFYAHLAITLASTLSVVYYTLYADRVISRRILIAAGVALFLLVVGIRVYNLNSYPPLDFTDEPWILSWVISYLRTGRFTNTIVYQGGLDIQLFYVPMAFWMRIVGEGLWTGRLYNFSLTLILILFAALTARNLYGNRAALYTGLALFASTVVMAGARLRHDIGLGLAIAVSLYLYSDAVRQQRRWMHFGAGVAMGLGWFAHYHALIFGPAMAAGLYGPRYLRRWRCGRHWPEMELWLYITGGSLGGFIVFMLQILPQWGNFEGRSLLIGGEIIQLLQRIPGHFLSIAQHSHVEFLLVVGALVAAIRRGGAFDRSLLLIVFLAHLFLVVAVPSDYYVVALTPLYGLLIGGLLAFDWQKDGSDRASAPRLIASVFYLTPILALTVQPRFGVQNTRAIAPPPVIEWVYRHTNPADTVIVAEHYYYLWLYDKYTFYSPASYYQMLPAARQQYASEEEMWDEVGVNLFILDPNPSTYSFLGRLLESGYMDSRGYKVAARFPGERTDILVYQRQDR